MQATRETDTPKRRTLEEVIIDDGRSQTTLMGPFPIHQSGLHWRTVVDATQRAKYARGKRAHGVVDGNVVAMGLVHAVEHATTDKKVILYVKPPQ